MKNVRMFRAQFNCDGSKNLYFWWSSNRDDRNSGRSETKSRLNIRASLTDDCFVY
jgi:hypothetical protein